jgi:copper chaperone CopZ
MQSFFKVFLLFCCLFFTSKVMAQSTEKEVTFPTSAQCEMCKERIEKKLSKEKGIVKAVLNLDDKTMTVKFDDKILDETKVKKLVANVGYDAGEFEANPGAYKKLPKCCKKKADRK